MDDRSTFDDEPIEGTFFFEIRISPWKQDKHRGFSFITDTGLDIKK